MEVKIEFDRPILCYGCLSSDRQLTQVNGLLNTLFFQIRSDEKETYNNVFAMLCWECIAVLQKILDFKKQIQMAKYRLMEYTTFFYHSIKDEIPSSLSNLTTVHTNSYNYIYIYNDKEEIETKEAIDVKVTIEPVIKEEKLYEIPIKHEINDHNEEHFSNNDTDFIDNDSISNDTKLNSDGIVNVKSESKKVKKAWSRSKSIQSYEKYANVIDRNIDFELHNIEKYNKIVCLDENEYEMYLKCLDNGSLKFDNKKLVNKCVECRKAYLRPLDLMRHKALNHDMSPFPRKCQSCKTVLNTQDEVRAHWREVHTVMLQCTLCDQVCRNTAEVRKHLNRTHTKIYICSVCNMDIPTLRQFSVHYQEKHEKGICDYCNQTYSKKINLEKHIMKWHIPAHCDICNKTYKSYHRYHTHCVVYHPKTIDNDEQKELSYCVECDKQFSSVHRYKTHLHESVKHRPKKKVSIPCPDCGKMFTKKTYMKNHYNLIHKNVTKHYCNICDKYYANGHGLRLHTALVHQKLQLPKNKICDICGRGFTNKTILTNHRRTHTGERPFKCQYCPASFAQITAMKTHQKTQHKNISL